MQLTKMGDDEWRKNEFSDGTRAILEESYISRVYQGGRFNGVSLYHAILTRKLKGCLL
jgi:hypothetical protein